MSDLTHKEFERLLYLDNLLRSGKYFNTGTLLGHYKQDFGISSDRTIKRDIDRLKTYFRAPVEYDHTRKTYYYSEESFFLPSVLLSDGDLFSMLIAEQILEQYEESPVYTVLHEGFEKIKNLMSSKHKVDPFWLEKRIVVISPVQCRIDSDLWTVLIKCLKEDLPLKFNYKRPQKEPVPREVEPYHLVSHRGAWYLFARAIHDEYSEPHSFRMYHLGRISDAVTGTPSFRRDESVIPADYFDPELGVFVKSPRTEIVVEFDPEIKDYIEERLWHPTAYLEDLPDGKIRMTFSTNQVQEAFYMLLPWLKYGKVISPPEMVEMAMDYGKSLVERHS